MFDGVAVGSGTTIDSESVVTMVLDSGKVSETAIVEGSTISVVSMTGGTNAASTDEAEAKSSAALSEFAVEEAVELPVLA